ncbi:hypothetical protein T484DRAFT_1773464 [Baffinella frigidus]|nr:hypothetical protein T484DRAFT_1773464 [Cryptophyta sp. CCMP2293]
MGVLRRLLEANRAELCPEFVKAAEKGRSWFRVSAASANKAAKNVLRQDLMCAACFVQVVIVGLKGATHLNGKFATLLREEPASGRWVLALAEGGKKSVKGENLEQNLAQAAAYEAAELFRGVPSFSVPIEEEEAPSDLKTIKMMDCNDEAVKVNTVRSNVHGDKVFVVKAQFIEPLPGRTGQNNVFLYDQLRHNSINAKGGADRVTPHLTCYKAYLHAQRDGRCLRIFSGRLPAQEQSF